MSHYTKFSEFMLCYTILYTVLCYYMLKLIIELNYKCSDCTDSSTCLSVRSSTNPRN